MSSWELIDTAAIPNNGGELRLFKRNQEFVIRIKTVSYTHLTLPTIYSV